MKIIFLGDVDARPGRIAVKEALPKWINDHKPDLVIANAENSASGFGATPKTLDELASAGVDCFTMGDHCFDQDYSKIVDYPIVRPDNLIEEGPGIGHRIIAGRGGQKVLLINLIGYAFMKRHGTNYFTAADDILKRHENEELDAIFVDFHAEATSEKNSLAQYLDGRITGIVGTHTHIPTADTRVLPKGTAFQTDAGMCGATESIIGVTLETSMAFLLKEMGENVKKGPKIGAENRPYTCDGVLIEVSGPTQATSITRLTSRT